MRGLDSPDDAECYTPEEQTGFDWQFGVVRTSAPPTTLISAIRDQVRAIDKDVAEDLLSRLAWRGISGWPMTTG